MQGRWKLGCLAFILIFAVCVSAGLYFLLHSTGPVSLSDFEEHYGHAYYADMTEADNRMYFEGSVDDLIKELQAETDLNLAYGEAAAYLEYLLEAKGYQTNIVVGEELGELGIIVYDELRDDWVQWSWGTQSLADFASVVEGSDEWRNWTDSREYQDIHELKESELIDSFAWWNSPQTDELDAFAQSKDYTPAPGFGVSYVDAYVDDNSWDTVEGERKAYVEISFVISRYEDHDIADPEIQLKVYDNDEKLLERSVLEDDVYRNTETLLLDEGSHSITVQIARYGTLAHGDCFIEIHPPSFYQPLEKCTYSEMLSFLNEDTTEQNEYVVDEYNCRNFSCDLVRNANSSGIKAAFVTISYYNEVEGHALAVFDTVDEGLVFVEPQGDEVIDWLQYGVFYGDENKLCADIGAFRVRRGDLPEDWPEMDVRVERGFFASLDETLAPYIVLTYLGLSSESEGSQSYVEEYADALSLSGYSNVSDHYYGTYDGWDVMLGVENYSEYEYGDECWTNSLWRVWDDGVVVPMNTNALKILFTSCSD